MTTVTVASTSAVKLKATIRAAHAVFGVGRVDIGCVDAASGVPEQPVGVEAGKKGAFNRIEAAEKKLDTTPDFLVGIENFIVRSDNGSWNDQAVVIVKRTSDGEVHVRFSTKVHVGGEYVQLARDHSPSANTTQGFPKTVGACIEEAMVEQGIETSGTDWYRLWHDYSREDAVAAAVLDAFYAFEN